MDFKSRLIHLKDKIYPKLKSLISFISHFIPEICVIVGLFFIIKTTFIVNIIAGLYLTGGILLSAGLFLANMRK